ncbi:MAG: DUF3857 domain-containing protein [Kiritimatiellae bacterium]|nr:DUF3857 domain-containing protein [Kiritimatiellia bacterium]
MQKFGRWLSIAFFAVTVFVARAGGTYSHVTVEKYPDADAVLVDSVEETRYKPDGTYVSEDYNTVKILTEKGRREESVISLSFNARYGVSKILEVKVTSADGTVRDVDFAKTTKEATDNSSVSANIYDPMDRKIVCTIPGLKIGDVVYYRTRKEVRMSRVKDHYADISVFEWTCPILRQTVRIIAPKERPLKRMAVRNPLGNVKYSSKTLADGSVEHVWVAKDSPQAFAEPNTPPLYKVVQNLYVSTAEDWQTISRWYWDLCVPHLSKTTPAISNQVSKIVASCGEKASDYDKISAIYKWVAQEVRYMGLTMEETSPGYAPHDVNITFENRYGVCRDKAALLAAMLRIAGFEAYPVLIHAGAKMDNEVPLPYFNHAITGVRAPGSKEADKAGYILMDPTDESSRDIMPAYLGDRSYLVATPFGETLHLSSVPPARANSLDVESEGTIEKDGSLLIKSVVRFKGLNDNAYRRGLLKMTAENRRRFFERAVKGASSSAELISAELKPDDLRKTEEELSVELLFRINEAVLKGKSREELTVPALSRILGVANWAFDGSTSLLKRRFPLVISSTSRTTERIRIKLGDSIGGTVALPEDISIDGAYSFSRKTSVKDGVYTMERVLSVNEVEFSPAEYAKLLDSLKTVEAAERQRAVFAKSRYADAHVRYREIAAFVNVTGPKSWVVTNVVEKEILTYDGKKKSAELKFSYNPTWKNIDVVSATVMKADGSVASVSDREKSVLDAGWASSAPRYPATKELIVNLPSVEIGSVIKYVTVTTVTNAPAPFYATWNFDSTEPIDLMRVDYRDWKGGRFVRTEKNLKRLPSEPMMAPASFWRETKTVALGDFMSAADNLEKGIDVESDEFGGELASAKSADEEKIETVRNWMAKYIRISGPSLYETPLSFQTTPVDTVLKERYASRFDYIRTMCALMKGAGLDADIVFAANDFTDAEETRINDILRYPKIGKYSIPVCRVRVKSGSFLGMGGTVREYFIGTENEYTPVTASSVSRSTYLDVDSEIPVDQKACIASDEDALLSRYTIYVRENGAVDIEYEQETKGASVGAFRKLYSEMLPEDRSRHFQKMLGTLAQAASATRELVTDIQNAKLSFSAFIPDYATKAGDTMTVTLPEIGFSLSSLTGSVRETPIFIPGNKIAQRIEVKVVFPEGYTEIEHLPETLNEYGYHIDAGSVTKDSKGRLAVTVSEWTDPRRSKMYAKRDFASLKDFSRVASSRANRTIIVRRKAR